MSATTIRRRSVSLPGGPRCGTTKQSSSDKPGSSWIATPGYAGLAMTTWGVISLINHA